jgi:hypothetical protein
MAVTYTVLADDSVTQGAAFGTGPKTSASFTPVAGTYLVAITGVMVQSGVTDPSGALTITDSQGLTWTRIGIVGNASTWSIGMAAWVCTVTPAASSMTITLDCGANNVWRYFITVLGVAASSGSAGGFASNTAAAVDGAYSETLSAAPTANDLSVFARFLDNNGTPALSMGAGWTVATDRQDSGGGGALAVATRGSSTSSTVSVSDAAVGSAANKAIDFAFNVTAMPPPPPPSANRARLTRASCW